MDCARLSHFAAGLRCGVVLFQNREELSAVASKVAQHLQRIPETVNCDSVLRAELLDELDEVALRIGESEILHPVRRGLVIPRCRTVKSIQVVEQDDGDAP